MEKLAKLTNISSDSNLTKIRKFYNEIELQSNHYSTLLVPMIMGAVPPQLKLVVSCNLRLELWGLAELLNLTNTEIKARANCGEYNFSQGNELDHLDMRNTSAMASQASKRISNK